MTRSFLRAVARCLVGGLFMAQMAIAAYACPALSSGLTGNMQMQMQMRMPSASLDEHRQPDARMPMAQPGKCADMLGTMDESLPNLCAEHCKVGQQSDKAPTLNAPVAVLIALYAMPLVPQQAPPPRSAASTLSVLVAASPPHTVLHCVYRI